MAEEKEKEGEEPKPKSKKKLIIIIAVVLVVAAAAFALLGGKKEKKESEDEVEEVKHYQTVELDHFVVNLSESKAFLKIKMLLEYDPKIFERAHSRGHGGSGGGGGAGAGGGGGGPSMPAVMVERMPMVRDAAIRVLSSKKSDELLTLEGKERLKEELIEAINEAIGLEEGPIVGIYFLEFIIQ